MSRAAIPWLPKLARMQTAAGLNIERLPAASDVAVAPTEPPQGTYPALRFFSGGGAAGNPGVRPSGAGLVHRAGCGRLAAAVGRHDRGLGGRGGKDPTADVAQQARLRMLYAAAGRREDAMRPFPAASPAGQQFLSKEMEGLSTWLNVEQAPDAGPGRRNESGTQRGACEACRGGPANVRNLAFCTEIQSYGCTKRFEKYEFQPNQEVLLYAEVENFCLPADTEGISHVATEQLPDFDARGQRLAEHAFATTEEYCENRRRDFFIGYHLCLPKEIQPGSTPCGCRSRTLRARSPERRRSS